MTVLYADFDIDTDILYVETPEGTKFTFEDKTDGSSPIKITDPTSGVDYCVVFDI